MQDPILCRCWLLGESLGYITVSYFNLLVQRTGVGELIPAVSICQVSPDPCHLLGNLKVAVFFGHHLEGQNYVRNLNPSLQTFFQPWPLCCEVILPAWTLGRSPAVCRGCSWGVPWLFLPRSLGALLTQGKFCRQPELSLWLHLQYRTDTEQAGRGGTNPHWCGHICTALPVQDSNLVIYTIPLFVSFSLLWSSSLCRSEQTPPSAITCSPDLHPPPPPCEPCSSLRARGQCREWGLALCCPELTAQSPLSDPNLAQTQVLSVQLSLQTAATSCAQEFHNPLIFSAAFPLAAPRLWPWQCAVWAAGCSRPRSSRCHPGICAWTRWRPPGCSHRSRRAGVSSGTHPASAGFSRGHVLRLHSKRWFKTNIKYLH